MTGCPDCGAREYETTHWSIHIDHTHDCPFTALAREQERIDDATVEEYGTDARISALRYEAAEAGDTTTERDCVAALDGDTLARLRCARIIADAADRARE